MTVETEVNASQAEQAVPTTKGPRSLSRRQFLERALQIGGGLILVGGAEEIVRAAILHDRQVTKEQGRISNLVDAKYPPVDPKAVDKATKDLVDANVSPHTIFKADGSRANLTDLTPQQQEDVQVLVYNDLNTTRRSVYSRELIDNSRILNQVEPLPEETRGVVGVVVGFLTLAAGAISEDRR